MLTYPPLQLKSMRIEPSGPLLALSMFSRSMSERSFLNHSHLPWAITVPMQSMIADREIVARKEMTALSCTIHVS